MNISPHFIVPLLVGSGSVPGCIESLKTSSFLPLIKAVRDLGARERPKDILARGPH